MTTFLEIITIVLPVFLVIALGFGLKRTGLVNSDFLYQLNRLLYYLALPLLLFYKIATADFSTSFNIAQVLTFILTTAFGFCISYGYAAMRNYPAKMHGTFSQACFRGNLAFMGLAIIFNAYGEAGLASAGVIIGFAVPTLNFFSILALLLPHRHNRDQPALSTMTRQIIGNPLIIACFIGIGWSFCGLPVPQVLDKALHIVTGMTLPLALISIGASFSLKKIRGDLPKALLATCIKLVVLPLVAAVLLLLMGVQGRDLAIVILFAGTPTAAAAYIMSQQMGGDEELSGTIIMLSTLLSAVTYTIILFLLRALAV